MEGAIKQIADFLGKKLTDEQVTNIKEHCRFENMKENSAVNYFRTELGVVDSEGSKQMLRKGIQFYHVEILKELELNL